MRLLAFETATPTGGVALYADGRILGSLSVYGSQSHSRHCLQFAETLLASAGLGWKDLSAVAASHGPGSFTGLRIGLTIIKSLGWSLGIRCVTVSTLEAMAYGCLSGEASGHVAPIIDARMGEVYTGLWRREGSELVAVGTERVVSPQDAAASFPPDTLVCGEGAATYRDAFSQFPHARPDRLLASPATVAMLAARKLHAGQTLTPQDVVPLYIRDPQYRTIDGA